MVELIDGLWVAAEDIKAVKYISKHKCTVWVAGIEPLVVDCAAEEVLEALGYGSNEDEDDEG